ncbi:FxsB family cyclophane-forming radical SAM/SPASM peptide maturase [Nonomuraea sp. NPDC055795]
MDVEALRDAGWAPTPFREFILKVHGRCNLACDYCYVYEMADQSWLDRPSRMSPTVAERTAARIAEHLHRHAHTSADVVLHGGEPLLAGTDAIEHLVTAIRLQAGPGTHIRMFTQTNATLLNDGFFTLFEQLDVKVGVSLDGTASAHDRHRRNHGGRGSHAAATQALKHLMGPLRHLYSGLLCTIDLRNDPLETYEALLAFHPPSLNFLLPHGNWSSPPPGRDPDSTDVPYGRWLTAVFDRWYHAPQRETQIRLFEEIMHVLLGGVTNSEAIGLSPVTIAVVETDGSIEQSDILKSAYPGAGATGLNVTHHSFDDALALPLVIARQIGGAALAATCRSCRIRRTCGGGLYAHRYRAGSGFANPSVYCRDLYWLITHIEDVLTADIIGRLGHINKNDGATE